MLDITGQKFGKWTAIEPSSYKQGTMWLCECECGVRKPVRVSSLRAGTSISCGCSRGKTYDVHNHKQYRHSKYFYDLNGLSKHPLYDIWSSMKYRCYDPKGSYYEKGIRICDEWIYDFMSFYNWAIQNGYKEGLSIDRINTYGNYCPDNCRWADDYLQANNKTNSLAWQFYDGKLRPLSEISRITGIGYKKLYYRMIKKGMSIEDAIKDVIED